MANFSLDEWGTPVIGGAISICGDVGANNVLGGKTVMFNLNPQKVLFEIVYGISPSISSSVVREIVEAATFADARMIEALSYLAETATVVESGMLISLESIKAEVMMLSEWMSREVHATIPAEYVLMVDTYLKDAITSAVEAITISDSRMVGDIEIVKEEGISFGDLIETSLTRILTESTRIRDVITNSFIHIITGIDEWGNPVIGLMTPWGDVVRDHISGGKDFVIRKSSWIELTETFIVLHGYSNTITKVFLELPTMVDMKIADVAKLLLEEITSFEDSYSPYVEAIRGEVAGIADSISQSIVIRYLNEIPIMVDAVSKRFPRYPSELMYVADTMVLYPTKIIRDTIDFADSQVHSATHFMEELLTFGDDSTITFWFGEIVTFADIRSVIMYREISELMTIVDSYYRTQFLYEIATMNEDMYAMFWKYMDEMISVVDSYRNLFTKIEVTGLSDVISRNVVYNVLDKVFPWDRTVRAHPMHYITDIVCATDSTIKYYITRPLVELVTGVDSLLKQLSKTRTEKMSIYDSRGNSTITKYISDTVSVVDNLIGRSFAILFEKVYAADTFSRDVITNILEHFHVKDYRIKHPLVYANEVLTFIDTKISHPLANMAESILISDVRVSSPLRYIRDPIRVIDTKYKHVQIIVTNIIAFIDGKYISYSKVLSEAFPLIESRYAMANHYIIDSFKLKDSRISHPLRYASELLIPLETRMMGFVLIDSLVIGDSISRMFTRFLSDVIKPYDRVRKSILSVREEASVISDVLSRSNISRILTEITTIIDDKRYEITRYLLERARHIDSKISRSMKYLSLETVLAEDLRQAYPSKILAETLSAIDSYSKQVSAFCQERLRSIDVRNSRVVFAISDLLLVTDEATSAIRKMLTETVLHLDTNVRNATKILVENTRALQRFVKWPNLTQLESINFSDEGVRIISKRVLTDALTVGDSLQRTLVAYVNEAIHIADKKRKEYTSTLEEHFHMGDALRSFKSLFRRHGSNASQMTRQSVTRQTTKTTTSVQDTHQAEIDEDAD